MNTDYLIDSHYTIPIDYQHMHIFFFYVSGWTVKESGRNEA